MTNQTHVHKLKRHKYKTGVKVFFCTLPDCHYRIDVELALGKRSLCNICGKEFLINEYTIKLAKPHCQDCGREKVTVDGKSHYVRKTKTPIATNIAEENIKNLRSRLNAATLSDSDDI